MKVIQQSKKFSPKAGFALVVTIMLMALLVLIALAMLSMGSVELRTSKQSQAMAEARSNARMALTMALGELQKAMGQDRRISADSQILDRDGTPVSRRNIIGVWGSLGEGLEDASNVDPLIPAEIQPTYADGRQPRFRKWLMPSNNPSELLDMNFVRNSGSSEDEVTLVGEGTFGPNIPDPLDPDSGPNPDASVVTAPVIELSDGTAYSWWIGQENTKARAGLERKDAEDAAQTTNKIAGGVTPSIRSMNGLDAVVTDETANKVISDQLLVFTHPDQDADEVSKHFFDLSVHSESLLTDVVNGGPKRDLNLLFELGTPPAGLSGTAQVYQYGQLWDEIRNFYRIYKSPDEGGKILWDGAGGLPSGIPIFYPAQTQAEMEANQNRRHWVPVKSKWYWLLSHFTEPSTVRSGFFEVHAVMDQVFELWNPFSLPYMPHSGLTMHSKQWGMPYGLHYELSGGFALRYDDNGQIDPRRTKYYRRDQRWDESNVNIGENLQWIFRNGQTFQMNNTRIEIQEPLMAGEVRVYSDLSDEPMELEGILDMEPGWNVLGGRMSNKLGTFHRQLHVSGSTEIKATLRTHPLPRYGGSFFTDTTLYRGNNGDAYLSNIKTRGAENTLHPQFLENDNTFAVSDVRGHENRQAFAVVGSRLRTEVEQVPTGLSPMSRSQMALVKPFLYTDFANQFVQCIKPGDSDQHKQDFARYMTHNPHEFFTQVLTDFDDSPLLDVSVDGNKGFMGHSLTAENGQSHVPLFELPYQPMISLGQLQHAPLGRVGFNAEYFPSLNHSFGNSFSQPFIPTDALQYDNPNHDVGGPVGNEEGDSVAFHDKSYLSNVALWDSWFFSGIAPQNNPLMEAESVRDMSEVITEAINGTGSLPNENYTISADFTPKTPDELEDELNSGTGYQTVAAYMSARGGFNVNSTSVEAWKAFLSSLDQQTLKMLKSDTGAVEDMEQGVLVSRFTLPMANGAKTDDLTGDQKLFLENRWQGARALSETELSDLAQEIVEQVKLRGPFLSLADFVNRRLDAPSELSQRGALQVAIDKSGINDSFNSTARVLEDSNLEVDIGTELEPDVVSLDYANPDAALGPVSEGAPGFVTQADLLNTLAPQIMVRSDTYRIRGYGEAKNEVGEVQARAYCEAIVQRTPAYVDPANDPEEAIVDLNGGPLDPLVPANKQFGRQFVIKSFKWLSPDEV